MRLKKKKASELGRPPQAAPLVSVQFRFEHRDSQGHLITTNKNLKNKVSLKDWLKRLFHIA